MTDPTVTPGQPPDEPKQKRVDELTRGEWINADDEDFYGLADVLHVETYPSDPWGVSALLVYRPVGETTVRTYRFPADTMLRVATEAEVAAAREQEGRARRIAEIRAFADWLEANPGLPLSGVYMQVSLDPHGNTWEGGAEGVAEVRRLADVIGEKADESSDDRTQVTKTFGHSGYCLIAWHKSGRPAEIEPDPSPAQLAAVADKLRADQEAELGGPVCQGAPAGFETDCGISGGHGPHPVEA